tara:strand:- start:1231 stop:1461 length:231 start_codon:yes stop_codon:yes gene_type:complete
MWSSTYSSTLAAKHAQKVVTQEESQRAARDAPFKQFQAYKETISASPEVSAAISPVYIHELQRRRPPVFERKKSIF